MPYLPYIIIAVAALLVIWLFGYFVPVGLWISALAAGVPVGPMTFIGMRLRKVNPHKV
ncbi:flotillin-like FloA family protein, partial [Candidatus Bipolaricaulota bacterium]|nr:flotillin-like FloA family protein [Candidatus Bipolaricaulota bacterium]